MLGLGIPAPDLLMTSGLQQGLGRGIQWYTEEVAFHQQLLGQVFSESQRKAQRLI